MSHSRRILGDKRKVVIVSALVSLAVAALTYLWYDYRFPSWKEEVVLPDGRKIIVKQRRDFIEGYGTRKTWLTFSLPEMGGEQTWEQWLYPTMIGVADGKVYVVGRPRGSKQFSIYSHPKYVYVAYRWHNNKFERIPFLQVPESLRREENVRWCMPGGADSKQPAHDNVSWCAERIGNSKFLMTKKVDLQMRIEEAKYWAGLGGHAPDSE